MRSTVSSAGIRIALARDVVSGFYDYRRITSEPAVVDISCPKCSNKLSLGEWLSQGGGKRTNIGVCPEHGEMLIKLICRKDKSEKWSVQRTLSECDEHSKESYNKKLEKQHASYLKWKAQKEKKNDNDSIV